MTIQSLIDLTDGSLQNEPTIQEIEGATVFPSKIEDGDLFISSNQEDIETALSRGAFAIIYDDDNIKIVNKDIAWIKVQSIQDASFKLLRYVMLEKEASFFLLNEHENSFLKMILLQKSNITFISNDWRKAFEQILNSAKKLFVGTDKELMKRIKPDVKRLKSDVDGYIVDDSLFKTTFKVNGYIYQDKELAPFHIEHILKVVNFCEENELPYSPDRVKYTKHFTPVFIDGSLNPIHSSKSEKVAIFTDNLQDINRAREYIKFKGTWIKSIVITPPKTKVENITRPHWFETEDEVKDFLMNLHFNYACVYVCICDAQHSSVTVH